MSHDAELLAALRYLFEVADRHDLHLGEYQGLTNYESQIEEWRCFGCDGKGVSRWPEWKLSFTHEPNCRYVKARELGKGSD